MRRGQHRRRADHRPGDGVLHQGVPEHAGPALPAHLAGRDRFDVVLESGDGGRGGAAAQDPHQPAGCVQRRVRVDGRRHRHRGQRRHLDRDARQAAGRSRVPGLHQPAKEHAAVGQGQAARRSIRVPGVRAAGQAHRDADDVVHEARRAGVVGQQHQPQHRRHHHQMEPVPGHRRGRGDVRPHARDHDRRAQGARPEPRCGQHGADRLLPLRGRQRRHLARPRARLVERQFAPAAQGRERLGRVRGVREAHRQARRPRDERDHLSRQLARLLGQRARLQPHRVQRAVPAGRQRRRLHQAWPRAGPRGMLAAPC